MVEHLSDDSHADRLNSTAQSLGFSDDDFRLVSASEWPDILSAIEQRFGNNLNFLWWRSSVPVSIPRTARHFDYQTAFRTISHVVPNPEESVWFICENWGAIEPRNYDRMVVFEGRPRVIELLLGEFHGFEYVLVSKDLDWIVGEDHHDVVFAAGVTVVSRLANVAT